MSGGGANLANIKATDQSAYGTAQAPTLSGNMGAAMGGMGFGNVGSAIGGQSGSAGVAGQNYGPVTNQQQLGQMNDLLRGQTPAQQVENKTPPPMAAIGDYYQNILGRAPDDAGLAYWTNAASNGMSMDAIKQSFLNSNEYKNSPAAQQSYANYLASQQTAQNPVAQQQAAPAYVPRTTTWTAQSQGPVFNNNPIVTQSGGEGSGGAMNFQYRRGGIASLLGR